MIKYLLIVLAVLVLIAYIRRGYRLYGRPFLVRTFLIGIVLATVALAVMGKMHWLGVIFASLLAILQRLLPFLLSWGIQLFPFIRSWQQERQQENTMTRREAMDILGLSDEPTRQEIIEAHRRLIQKVHPDRGGNPYLAARLNQAKATLLNTE